MRKILPVFSYVFHPIFIPLFGTIFYATLDNQYFTVGQYLMLFLQIIIITFLLPISFFYLLRTFGKIDNVMLSDIAQRKIPLLLQLMLFTVLITKSITLERFPNLHYFFVGGLISTFIAFLLLYLKIKTSIHMIGISALTVFIIGLSIHNEVNTINIIAFFVLLNGLVASSRLVMEAHNIREIGIGILCGTLPQFTLFYFWL